MTSSFLWPIKGAAFVAARPAAFRRFWQAAAVYAITSAVILAAAFALLLAPQYALLARLLGPSWLAWQLASGAVLAEASWPLFLVLQLRQGDLTDNLFADVMREVGAPAPPPLPVAERQEIEKAGAALRRQRAAALTGAAAPFTAPLQVARDLLKGRPGDSMAKGWARCTATSPLLLFWPYGPALYAWLNGYATGVGHHVNYYKAKGVTDREEQEVVAAGRAAQYRRFGFTAMALSLLPVVGWTLSILSAAGAALWAADIERSGGRLHTGGTKVVGGAEYISVQMADLEEGRRGLDRA
jgi:hypothetical protein